MSSVYDSSVYESSELSTSENFSLGGVKDKIKNVAQKTGSTIKGAAEKTGSTIKSAAEKTGSTVVSGAKKVGSVAKAGFNFFTGWINYVIIAVILMGLIWVYRNFFA